MRRPPLEKPTVTECLSEVMEQNVLLPNILPFFSVILHLASEVVNDDQDDDAGINAASRDAAGRRRSVERERIHQDLEHGGAQDITLATGGAQRPLSCMTTSQSSRSDWRTPITWAGKRRS